MSLFTSPSELDKYTPKRRKRAIQTAKIVFSIVYFGMGGEIFLRVLDPMPLLPRHVCAAPYGIRGNEPNRSYWHVSPSYCINIRTNSKGIRADEEISYEKPAGTKRIVLLGDSFGMGYEVNLEDTFSEQMIKSLRSAGIQCQLVNLSVSGYGNAEEMIVLQEEGLKYQPDLVLLAWHDTDYLDNVRSNLFGLEKGRLVRKSNTYLPGVRIQELLYRIPGYLTLSDHSQFYSFIREWLAFKIKGLLVKLHSKPDKSEPTEDNPTEGSGDSGAYSKDLAIALLKEIKRVSATHGAKFLILDIPIRKSRTTFESSLPCEAAQYFHLFCPIELFKQYKGQKLYWEEKSHHHFTPLGCHIVGVGLAQYILSNNLLEKLPTRSDLPTQLK